MSTRNLPVAATDCRVFANCFLISRASPLTARGDAFALSPNRKMLQLEDGTHEAVGIDE